MDVNANKEPVFLSVKDFEMIFLLESMVSMEKPYI